MNAFKLMLLLQVGYLPFLHCLRFRVYLLSLPSRRSCSHRRGGRPGICVGHHQWQCYFHLRRTQGKSAFIALQSLRYKKLQY